MSTSTADLQQWCLLQLSLSPDQTAGKLAVVSGDASFRRYYRQRLRDGRSVIVVHAPPDKENNEAFIRVQALLAGHGVRVPAVLAWDKPRGYLLLEDFGDQLLLPLLTDIAAADRYYRQAMALLLPMQGIALRPGDLPDYDRRRLREEMLLFPQWFIESLLGYRLGASETALLDRMFARLLDSALAQPQVLVHRDFHSRNIMCLAEGGLGLIDFQDAVRGPVSYDLVSLLRDCYVRWPSEQVRRWALSYRDQAQGAGIIAAQTDAEFLRAFDWMGLQRHIKVLGIFARLKLRDGKTAYLKDLPLVTAYTLSIARGYEEFAEFVSWFEAQLLPLARRQEWFRELEL